MVQGSINLSGFKVTYLHCLQLFNFIQPDNLAEIWVLHLGLNPVCTWGQSLFSCLTVPLPTWKPGTTFVAWVQIPARGLQPCMSVLRITLTTSLISSLSHTILERTSASMLVFPDLYITVKLYAASWSTQWWPIASSQAIVRMYFKGLLSDLTVMWLPNRYSWNTMVTAHDSAKNLNLCIR